MAEITIARRGHIIVQVKKKSKWRHILANKQEVVITMAVSEVETQFRRLYLGFRGHPEEWYTDRQRIMHARYPN